jgi:hypothetical protein
MKLAEITTPSETERPGAVYRSNVPPVKSSHCDVQELIARFNDNQEMDAPALCRGELAFIGAVYMEVVDDPDWHPTSHILELIRTVNAQMRIGSKREVE